MDKKYSCILIKMDACAAYDVIDHTSSFLPLMLFFSMVPLIFGSLYGVYSALFDKDLPAVPVNLSDQSFYGENMKGLGGQQIKHRFVIVRHGESEHNVNLENGSQDHQVDSPLTCVGHEQAKALAHYFERIGFIPDNICVSPMLRTRQTAAPVLKLYKEKIDLGEIGVVVSPKYMEINTWQECKVGGAGSADFTSYKETFTGFTKRVRELMEHMSDWSKNLEKPTQTLIFSHSMVISELLNHIVNKERQDISDNKWSKIYWQVANGSLTCIDYTVDTDGRNEWHIQAMNYTKHLPILSGVKSPFV